MIPDIELRLDSVRRALTEVILPAIDTGNSLAIEQAMLAIGHIGMIIDQADKAVAYAALCFADLAEAMADLPVASGPQSVAAHGLANALQLPEQCLDCRDAYCAATAALDHLIRTADTDADTDFRRGLHQRVLAFTKRQSGRERSWFAASGFDPDVRSLPSIEAMIGTGLEISCGS